MELIYIYVENYKVLDKAEISLSSFYKVKKTKKTFHIENSEVPPSFYKDNIDIIAIFGKNGSGKSTCIEMIQKILSFEIEEDINFIAIFKIGNSFYFYSELSSNIEVTYNESPIPELYEDDFKIDISLLSKKDKIIYFSHQVEPLKQKAKKQKNIIDCSNQHYINSIGKEPFIQNEIKSCFSLLDIYDMAGFGLNKIPMSGVIHTPSVIFKNLKSTIKNIKDLVALFLEERDSNLLRTEIDIEKVREAISSIQSIYKINSIMEQSNKSDDNFHYKNIEELTFSRKNFLFQKILDATISIEKSIKQLSENYTKNIESIETLLILNIIKYISGIILNNYKNRSISSTKNSNNKKEPLKIEEKESYENKAVDLFNIAVKVLEIHGDVFYYPKNKTKEYEAIKLKIFKIIHNVNGSLFISGTDVEYLSSIMKYEKSFKSYQQDAIELIDFIDSSLNVEDEKISSFEIENFVEYQQVNDTLKKYYNHFSFINLRWNGISSGQYSLLTMYARIFSNIKGEINYTIMIDEGEVNLHPEWQRSYISNLIKFLNSVNRNNQKFKIILTSHSPFVLGDLPNDSVNILQSESKDSFFGANIFDIYNKGFLLERPSGEFSYQKILEAVRAIKSNKEIKGYEFVLNNIGDNLIKKLVENLKND